MYLNNQEKLTIIINEYLNTNNNLSHEFEKWLDKEGLRTEFDWEIFQCKKCHYWHEVTEMSLKEDVCEDCYEKGVHNL